MELYIDEKDKFPTNKYKKFPGKLFKISMGFLVIVPTASYLLLVSLSYYIITETNYYLPRKERIIHSLYFPYFALKEIRLGTFEEIPIIDIKTLNKEPEKNHNPKYLYEWTDENGILRQSNSTFPTDEEILNRINH